MKFDLERALEWFLWAVLLALLGVMSSLFIWAIVKVPVIGLVVAYLVLAILIGGFWPRRK